MIELLVVISIVAVLAALFFPAFGQIRRRSQQTVSINNLRQWGSALCISLADNNGSMPTLGWDNGVMIDEETAWFNKLPRYLGMKPLSEMETNEYPEAGQKTLWVNPAVSSADVKNNKRPLFFYGMNSHLAGATQTMSIAMIEKPSATVMLGEGAANYCYSTPSTVHPYFSGGKGRSGRSGTSGTSSNDSANFLFCDGHAALVPRSVFYPEKDSTNDPTTYSATTDFTFIPYKGAN